MFLSAYLNFDLSLAVVVMFKLLHKPIFFSFFFSFIHVSTQCNISQVITVFKSVSSRCNDL